MDGSLQKIADKRQLEEFQERFAQAVEDRTVHVEFSLEEFQENMALQCATEDADEKQTDQAMQHATESYMRDMKEIGEKIDQAIENDTLQTDDEIGVDRYVYYHIRKAEIDGASPEEVHNIQCQKLRDFKHTKEQRALNDPLSSHEKSEEPDLTP
jgi:hypothetical protein